MDDIFRLTLFLHLGALVIAAATNVAMPMLGIRMASLAPEARVTMGSMAKRLVINARVGLVVLVVTGLSMVAMRYDAGLWSNPWFTAKMVFVAIIVAGLVSQLLPATRSVPPRVFGMITRFALIGTIFCAVMAFN